VTESVAREAARVSEERDDRVQRGTEVIEPEGFVKIRL